MNFNNKKFVRFLIIFFVVFVVCYYGLQFITGLAVDGGLYSPFVEKHINVGAWIRTALINSCKYFLSIFGIETIRTNEYVIQMVGGRGVRIVYGCLGFGVMSFWIAYVIATVAKTQKKVAWLFAGLLLLWFINIIRISLVLVSTNKGWDFPFGWDHHLWFNIIAYAAIFTMMYFFEKSIKTHKSIES